MDAVYRTHKDAFTRLLEQIKRKTRLNGLELAVLIAYPLTIALGQLLYHTGDVVVNYYTNKRNLVNTLFVKRGWFWTVLFTGYFLVQHRRVTLRSAARLALGTLWWVLFTQWFFGVPLMDRIFLMTGGGCQYDVLQHAEDVVGSVMCRRVKGSWIGGHDPSGHVFLLVHSSLIMWFELLECGLIEDLKKLRLDIQRLAHDQGAGGNYYLNVALVVLRSSSALLLILLGLWWWMLLVTSHHFHTFAEKITGLLAGYLGLAIYIVPRYIF